MKERIGGLLDENFHLKQRLQYHCEKMGKMTLEKGILFHEFERAAEKMFNIGPNISNRNNYKDSPRRVSSPKSCVIAPIPLSIKAGMSTESRIGKRWSSLSADANITHTSPPTLIDFTKVKKSSDHAM